MEGLRKTLKLKGVSFAKLAQALEISERSLSRVFSGHGLTVERLFNICDIIDVTLAELLQIGEVDLQHTNFEFTPEQEKFLAHNFNFMRFYTLLWSSKSAKAVAKEYNIDDITLGKILSQLEKLNLLKWLPHNEVELIGVRKYNDVNGELIRTHGVRLAKILAEKSVQNKDKPGFIFFPDLSKSAQDKIRVKMKEFYEEIKKDREIETLLGIPSETMGVLLCLEPFQHDYEDIRNWKL